MAELNSSSEVVTGSEAVPPRNRVSVKRIVFYGACGVFWVWQIALVILSLFAVLPDVLPHMWRSYQYYGMPVHYFVLSVILLFLPLVCLLVIAWLMTSGDGNRMQHALKFFYGFELPAILLLGLFLMNLRDYGLGAYWLVLVAFVGLAIWCALVFYERVKGVASNTVLFVHSPLAMAGSAVVFAVGAFVCVALLLFVVPASVFLTKNIFRFIVDISLVELWEGLLSVNWLNLLLSLFQWEVLLFLVGVVLFFTSVCLVIVLPLILLYLYIAQFFIRLKQSASFKNALVSVLVLCVLFGVHLSLNKQPQQHAFALLESRPLNESEKQALLDESETIRVGLLNAYLSRYRYLSTTGTANILTQLYTEVFVLDKAFANYPQRLFNAMFKPILYEEQHRSDRQDAAELYEYMFDSPIQVAEIDTIWDTLNFNGESTRQNAAGRLDVNQKSVHLQSQNIDVTADGQLATVRVTQKLVNKVTSRRETVVHFSLPEYAVITGVWLSNDESDLEQNAGLVAPRGAAQEVYNREVSRRIDPALLEKVGPEMYRLRVYPILRAKHHGGYKIIDGEPMFVTFEYNTLSNAQGTWPIPLLTEKRHLFWDENTVTTINGEIVIPSNNADWIPHEAGMSHPVSQAVTQMSVDQNNALWAVPRSYLQSRALYQLAPLGKTVVLIDGSRSMQKHAADVIDAVGELRGADLYFCQLECIPTTAETLTERVYFGSASPVLQLAAFLENNTQQAADRIVMLTDNGSYATANDAQAVVGSTVPVWVLHLGSVRPNAYADAWMTTVNQSGGGFLVGGVVELLTRLAAYDSRGAIELQGMNAEALSNYPLVDIDNDWLWLQGPAVVNADLSPYEKLGAARTIRRLIKSGVSLELEQLDALHALAYNAQIITELSSMIVLINNEQKKALKEASKSDDRFDRENENGDQIVGVPADNLSVAAVPEPEEWAMLIVVLMFATLSLYRRQMGFEGKLRV